MKIAIESHSVLSTSHSLTEWAGKMPTPQDPTPLPTPHSPLPD
ncbi:hypothetical protein [Egbenema bharatensis]